MNNAFVTLFRNNDATDNHETMVSSHCVTQIRKILVNNEFE